MKKENFRYETCEKDETQHLFSLTGGEGRRRLPVIKVKYFPRFGEGGEVNNEAVLTVTVLGSHLKKKRTKLSNGTERKQMEEKGK